MHSSCNHCMVYLDPGPVCEDCIDEVRDFNGGVINHSGLEKSIKQNRKKFDMDFNLQAPQRDINIMIGKMIDDAFQEESGVPEFLAGQYISCDYCKRYIHEKYYEEHMENHG